MSVFGAAAANATQGLSQAQRLDARRKQERAERRGPGTSRLGDPEDVLELTQAVEGPEAVRGAEGSDQEEAREDRESDPRVTPGTSEARPHIDLRG
ncbi:MAG: hypothetical protein RBS39_11595 [Phycisphaerales bacterium]|jgi:hypothetical protein|nr:hypothetical protein [Phycisphaerales bacterium]